jgi:hypothetical protein
MIKSVRILFFQNFESFEFYINSSNFKMLKISIVVLLEQLG